jgi:delta24(24(1))-sterol reductase
VYRCNGYAAWWLSLGLLAAAQLTGAWSLVDYYDKAGHVMTVAMVAGDALALGCYLAGVWGGTGTSTATGKAAGSMGPGGGVSGNPVYDFFMGSLLQARLGILDLKFFAEIRVSWYLLFLNTAAAAAKQHATTGGISGGMVVMLLAHGLYANACAKGEHYVPPTWDMFAERFGWMLSFWNLAGVPFLYATSPTYLVEVGAPASGLAASPLYAPALAAVLLAAYYVWDTAQSQKNHFRLQDSGTVVNRWTFPRLPWQTLANPRFLQTARGSKLLTDGWWRYARKIHYTCDIVMALVWGLTCGFRAFIPYFYVCFFTAMIVHRYFRDMRRCAAHYGADWDRYLALVPYAFIPGVI